MLQWLRRLGHRVDFANDPIFTPELPGKPSMYIPSPLALWDGKPCPYCGHEMRVGGKRTPTRDHKHPRSRGGTLSARNQMIVCRPCNGDKDSRTLEEWAHRLTALEDPRAGIVWDLIGRGG